MVGRDFCGSERAFAGAGQAPNNVQNLLPGGIFDYLEVLWLIDNVHAFNVCHKTPFFIV
jgi:hypothetical protein